MESSNVRELLWRPPPIAAELKQVPKTRSNGSSNPGRPFIQDRAFLLISLVGLKEKASLGERELKAMDLFVSKSLSIFSMDNLHALMDRMAGVYVSMPPPLQTYFQ